MARMTFGEKMPKTYLEQYKPVEGIPGTIAILSLDALVGVQSHFIDNTPIVGPQGTKGMFVCTGGICCASGLNPNQSYALPCWVYINPPAPPSPQFPQGNPGSADGIVQILKLNSKTYELLLALANRGVDLEAIDFMVTATPQGKGTAITLTPLGTAPILSKDYRRQIVESTPDLAGQIERSLAKPCTEEDWQKIVAEAYGQGLANLGQSGGQIRVPVRAANPMTVFGGQALPPGQGQALPPGQGHVPASQPVFHGSQSGGIQAQGFIPPGVPGAAHPASQPVQRVAPQGGFPGQQGALAPRVAPAPQVGFPGQQGAFPANQGGFPGQQGASATQFKPAAAFQGQQGGFPGQQVPQDQALHGMVESAVPGVEMSDSEVDAMLGT